MYSSKSYRQLKNNLMVATVLAVIFLYWLYISSSYLPRGQLKPFPNDVSSKFDAPSPIRLIATGSNNQIPASVESVSELVSELKTEPIPWPEAETDAKVKKEPIPIPPPSPYDPTKLAFLVETRPIPHLPALLAHMMSVVPPEWTFKFMGSNASITHMRRSHSITTSEASGKLAIVELPSHYSVKSRETISQMFTDPVLYSEILSPAEHLLVFQPDSIFCVNSEQSLNDWLEWDWVGAPWGPDMETGGNGGLSLRKVSRILEVLGKWRRRRGDGALEDMWLTSKLKLLEGYRLPNATISKRFSVESVWDDRPLGYHVGWLGVHHEQIWDTPEQLNHIWEYCPEVKLILGMNLTKDKPPGVD